MRDAVGAAGADEEHVTVVILLVGDAAVNNVGHEFHNRERPCDYLCNLNMGDFFTIKHFVGRGVVIVLKIVNVEGLRFSPIGAAHKLGCVVGGILLQLNENITDPTTVVVVPGLGLLAVLWTYDVAVGKDVTRVVRSVVFFEKLHHKFLKGRECG